MDRRRLVDERVGAIEQRVVVGLERRWIMRQRRGSFVGSTPNQ